MQSVASAESTGSKARAAGADAPRAPQAPAKPGHVHVRLAASEADILAMIALGRQMHEEGRFKKFFYDEARLLTTGRAAIKNGNPGIILAERDGQLVGMATVVASEQFFSPAKVASLHLLYVRKDARRGRAAVLLLRALRRWAQAAGAEELNLSTTMGVGMDRSDRFLRKLGFRQTGGNYVLEGL
jgi:GNAT superfamily N-acetyltransferase